MGLDDPPFCVNKKHEHLGLHRAVYKGCHKPFVKYEDSESEPPEVVEYMENPDTRDHDPHA